MRTIWSFSIILFTVLLNSYLLVFDRYHDFNNTISNNNVYKLSNGFDILNWERVHITIYCIVPFLVMVVFNILLIKKTFESNRRYRNNDKKLRNLTYSLIFISVSYIVMILPSALIFPIFDEQIIKMSLNSKSIVYLIDYLSFFNHSTLFFNCLMSNVKFRKIVFSVFLKITNNKFCI